MLNWWYTIMSYQKVTYLLTSAYFLLAGHTLTSDCFNRIFNYFITVHWSFYISVAEYVKHLGRQGIWLHHCITYTITICTSKHVHLLQVFRTEHFVCYHIANNYKYYVITIKCISEIINCFLQSVKTATKVVPVIAYNIMTIVNLHTSNTHTHTHTHTYTHTKHTINYVHTHLQ